MTSQARPVDAVLVGLPDFRVLGAVEDGDGLEFLVERSTATGGVASGCDPSYPEVCLPPPPPDLDCGQIEHRRVAVVGSDPRDFDGNGDGVGCETTEQVAEMPSSLSCRHARGA